MVKGKNIPYGFFVDIISVLICMYIIKYIYDNVIIQKRRVIYFDNASTTNIYTECLNVIVETYKKNWFNPSSVYE